MRSAEHCEAARVYRDTEREGPSHAQWWGIAIHRYIEYAQKYDRAHALRYVKQKFPRTVKACEALDLDLLPPGDHEVQFTIDVPAETATCQPDAPEGDVHVKAKCDLYSTALEVHVIDFKTGEGVVDPRTDLQVQILVVAAWLEGGKEANEVRGSTFNIYKLDGESYGFEPHSYVYSRIDLAEAFLRVRRIFMLTQESRADAAGDESSIEFNPGPHCRGCHMRLGCPKAIKDA